MASLGLIGIFEIVTPDDGTFQMAALTGVVSVRE